MFETIERKGEHYFDMDNPTEENLNAAVMDYIENNEIEFETLSVVNRQYQIYDDE